MFSRRTKSEVVFYYKLFGHDELGGTVPIHPERIIPALGDVRSRNLIMSYGGSCFSTESKLVQKCQKLLEAVGSTYNKKASRGKRLTRIEVQLWKWNFRVKSSDPNYGNLEKKYVVRIEQEQN